MDADGARWIVLELSIDSPGSFGLYFPSSMYTIFVLLVFFILSVCFDGVKDNELLIDIEAQGVKSGIESKASVDTRITAAQRTPT